MIRRLFPTLLFVLGLANWTAHAQESWTPEMLVVTEAWDDFLGKYLNQAGGVDYQAMEAKGGSVQLASVVTGYKAIDPTKLDDKGKLALYINFYNAGMIYNILQWASQDKVAITDKKFSTQLVNDIKAPGGNIWNGDWTFRLHGKKITLDGIEHGLIRGQAGSEWASYKVSKLDPRIHAAVNCAAYSCPRLREKAYRPANVDQMLDENMRAWFASPEQFKKLDAKKLRANQILFWYYSDFDDVGKQRGLGGAGGYLAQFIDPKANDGDWIASHLKKEFNDRSKLSLKFSSAFDFYYDWRIADSRIKQ